MASQSSLGRDAEVIALSSESLMATNQFICKVCHGGFPRQQNLQVHLKTHNLSCELKRKTHEVRKKVYVCPDIGCVHHHPSRALSDLSGIKKHFFRKHCEKVFSCQNCHRKYAVYGDLKAHFKICCSKKYKCACGTTMSRRDGFIYQCSVCDAHPEKMARVNSPYSSMSQGSMNSNPGSMSLGSMNSNLGSMSLGSAAGSIIQGNEQQLSYPLSGLGASASNSFTSLLSGQISAGSPFQPIQQPKTPLLPIPQSKLSFPRASNSSGIRPFPNYTVPSNKYKFGSNGGADFNSPQCDLNVNINNSFRGLMMNAEASAYNIQNSTLPSPQLSKTALLQEDAMTGANSINASVRKIMWSSLSGRALGDGMNGGGGGGSAGGLGGGMEHLSDQMNPPHGGLMYNMNNNVVVEPQMNVQSEYRDKLSKDFHGMGNGTNSLSGGGMVDHHNVNGMGTNLPDSEASTSADPRPLVLSRWPGF